MITTANGEWMCKIQNEAIILKFYNSKILEKTLDSQWVCDKDLMIKGCERSVIYFAFPLYLVLCVS